MIRRTLSLLLLAILLFSCSTEKNSENKSTVTPKKTKGKSKEFKTIVLISIDTIRADHMSCYGYPLKTTPNIDALAKESLFFENAYSPIPYTLPAHSSMLSSLYPITHGIHNNSENKLRDSILTLPEILQEAGYETFGTVAAAVLDNLFGLNQGFDVYDDTMYEHEIPAKVSEHSISDSSTKEKSAKQTTEQALKWLNDNAEKKKFMFIHYYDPHRFYMPPEPFNSDFKSRYDGEITYVDHEIGKIVKRLKELELYNDSLIVVTGDHAEMLNEHEEETHGFFIYHNVLQVPLMVKLPAGKHVAKINENCSIIDVAPTILSAVGFDIPEVMQGIDLLNYRDKNFSIPKRTLFSECFSPSEFKGGNILLGVMHQKWHYIQTTRPELFNKESDPEELNDLSKTNQEIEDFLQDELIAFIEETDRSTEDISVSLDEKMTKQIESLGYIGSSSETSYDYQMAFNTELTDPKDFFGTNKKIQLVNAHLTNNKIEVAIELCNQIIDEFPDIITGYLLLSAAYIKLQEYDKSINLLKNLTDKFPDSWELSLELALVHHASEKYQESLKYCYQSLELSIKNTDAQKGLDKTLFQTGKIHEILKEDGKIIELFENEAYQDFVNMDSLKLLSAAYTRAGNDEKLIEIMDKILTQEPNLKAEYFRLAVNFYTNKKYERVIVLLEKESYKKFLDFNSLNMLAGAHDLTNQVHKAIEVQENILMLRPNDSKVIYRLAVSYSKVKDTSKVIELCLQALKKDPNLNNFKLLIGETYFQLGQFKNAVEHYEKLLEQISNIPMVHGKISWIKATDMDQGLYDPDSALIHAEKAMELSAKNITPELLDILAVAQSVNGQFELAITTTEKAIKLCEEKNLSALKEELQKRLELYKQKKTLRE